MSTALFSAVSVLYNYGKKVGALCTLYSSALCTLLLSVSCRQQILGCVALVTPREAGLVLDDHPNTFFNNTAVCWSTNLPCEDALRTQRRHNNYNNSKNKQQQQQQTKTKKEGQKSEKNDKMITPPPHSGMLSTRTLQNCHKFGRQGPGYIGTVELPFSPPRATTHVIIIASGLST